MNFIISDIDQLITTLGGACDNCHMRLFLGDEIIENTEYNNTMLNLIYCDENCKQERSKLYPVLNNLTFTNKTLSKPVSINFYNIIVFMVNHPWSINYTTEKMITYIEGLNGKETLSWREKGFMNNFNKYGRK